MTLNVSGEMAFLLIVTSFKILDLDLNLDIFIKSGVTNICLICHTTFYCDLLLLLTNGFC